MYLNVCVTFFNNPIKISVEIVLSSALSNMCNGPIKDRSWPHAITLCRSCILAVSLAHCCLRKELHIRPPHPISRPSLQQHASKSTLLRHNGAQYKRSVKK